MPAVGAATAVQQVGARVTVGLPGGTARNRDYAFQGFLAEWLPAQQLTLVVSPIETQ